MFEAPVENKLALPEGFPELVGQYHFAESLDEEISGSGDFRIGEDDEKKRVVEEEQDYNSDKAIEEIHTELKKEIEENRRGMDSSEIKQLYGRASIAFDVKSGRRPNEFGKEYSDAA